MTPSLIDNLIDRLDREKILYCHWKSNIDLAKTLEGKLDIDLLVSTQSLARMTELLMQLGFKQAVPKWNASLPGVFHYYGYDPNKDDLIHLHMFTQILTGESFLKSHLFPFEEMLMNNVYSVDGLKVVSKEAELVLFVLRTYIKYGSLIDSIRLLLAKDKLREEAQWLEAGSDPNLVLSFLRKYCPVISDDLFTECLNALLIPFHAFKVWKLSFIIRRRLRPYRKFKLLGWLLGHIQLILGIISKKMRRQKGGKVLSSGGRFISIVGADATGKSTLVSETSRWLGKNFVVTTIHAGKPPSTLITSPVNFLLGIYRNYKGNSRVVSESNDFNSQSVNMAPDKSLGISDLVYAIRAVVLAWDRRALLVKMRHAVANGEIVVSDRYPTNSVGAMDSPRLNLILKRKGIFQLIYSRLAVFEKKLYLQIPPPDIVLRLNVSLETAKKRNAARDIMDDEVYLQNRHRQAKEWSMSGTRIIQDINTDHTLAETVIAVKQSIWNSL